MCTKEYTQGREEDVLGLLEIVLDLPERAEPCIAGALIEATMLSSLVRDLTHWLTMLKAKAHRISMEEAERMAHEQVAKMMEANLIKARVEVELQRMRN